MFSVDNENEDNDEEKSGIIDVLVFVNELKNYMVEKKVVGDNVEDVFYCFFVLVINCLVKILVDIGIVEIGFLIFC